MAAVVEQHSLGKRVDSYRTHRSVRASVLWVSASAAAVVALVAFVLGVGWLGYLAVPLTVLGVVAFARLVPPPGGRRTLTVFDHGVVEASAARVRAVNWSDVESVTREPGPGGGMTIAYRTGVAAEPERIDVDAAGRRRLLHLVEVGVRWHAIQRARAELLDQGKAAFGPVVVTSTGLELDGTDQRLAWERLTRVMTVDDHLVVDTTGTGGLLVAWFNGPVPHASAGASFINEVNPKTRRPATMLVDQTRAEAHPLRKHLIGLAVLALVIPIGYAGYARLFLPDQRSGSPDAGYASGACGERRVAYRSAAHYRGAGPHPIVAYHDDVPDQPQVKSSFPEVPAEWRPQTPALTQLIACVREDFATTLTTNVIQTCHGQDLLGGRKSTLTFYQAGYQVDIYEARTGKTIGSAHLQPTTAACPDSWETYRTAADSNVSVPVLPTAADYREALRKYVE